MKNKIIALSALVLFLGLGVFAILMFNKYKSFKIISIKQEYSIVTTSSTSELSIPLYFEKKNSFLTKFKNVKNSYIENDDYTFLTNLKSITEGETIVYDGTKYTEYIFKISFSSYDDFSDVIYVENGKFRVTYQNNEEMSYSIGNLELYFNSSLAESNIQVMQLSAITNVIGGVETIVGINLSLKNDYNSNITINSIKTLNKFYELDYRDYEFGSLDRKADLSQRVSNYSYTAESLDYSPIDLAISSGKYTSIFIPLKYLNGIRYVSSLPLFIEYTLNGETMLKVVDSFSFMKKNVFYTKNGIKVYEYSYK